MDEELRLRRLVSEMASKRPKHYLMRRHLITKEIDVIKGPSETSYYEESLELNQKHYEKKHIEAFGKMPHGGSYAPNKEYIWYDELK